MKWVKPYEAKHPRLITADMVLIIFIESEAVPLEKSRITSNNIYFLYWNVDV